MLTHHDFLIKNFMQYVLSKEGQQDIQPVQYRHGRKLRICPEPMLFLSQLEPAGSRKSECRRLFEGLIKTFKTIDLSSAPIKSGSLWFNTTARGIDLRLGLEEASSKPIPICMGDVAVHGLMVGQTGGGKSTLLHNIIFNLMAEYPPWELDLYMADFKRVEFSRYMTGDAPAPHICACAATSEIRYVLSLISYLVDCMNAREDFFKRMGISKIAEFRKMYPDVVLPRILLIVDEFQQMFLDASTKENEQIHQLMTAIVKKGRATGLHILFASQETSNTLSRSDLSNFRLRIAVNCSKEVSSTVLGNAEAARIKCGQALVNIGDGTAESNRKYLVPFIETEEKDDQRSYFDTYIDMICGMAQNMKGSSKTQKYYQEDEQEHLDQLQTILEKITPFRRKLLQDNRYFDVLTLGRYVTFSSQRHDIQTLFLEKGRNKNILALSSRAEDIAYLQRLLSLNFNTSPRNKLEGKAYQHTIFDLQPSVSRLFSLKNALPGARVFTAPEQLNALEVEFERLMALEPILRRARTPFECLLAQLDMNLSLLRLPDRDKAELRTQRM